MTVALSVVNSITQTANQTSVGGTANDPIIALATNPIIPGTGSITIPHGTTGQRVLNGIGSMRVNDTTGFAEISIDGATWVNLAVGGGGIASVTGTAGRITTTAGPNVVVNIDPTYIGQNTITTLGTITTGVWNGTAINETHGGTNQTAYVLGDTLYASGANTLARLAGNTTAAIQYLAQTGTGVVSAAPVWTTISGGDITGAALTAANDTNVTLTLGGTPATALLRAASITAGWAGQLSLARGGSNANLTASNGGIVWSNATQMQILAGTATASKMLLSGATAAPTWSTSTIPSSAGATANKVLLSDGTNYVLSTPTFPNASATAGKIIRSDGTNWAASTATFADTYTASNLLYSNGANTVTGLATANSATLVTSSTGVPSLTASMTNGQVLIGSTGATPTPATLTAGTNITITNGAGSITVAASAGSSGLKAWIMYNGTTGGSSITTSNNIASLTDNGSAGDFTINFTAAFATANYVAMAYMPRFDNGATSWSGVIADVRRQTADQAAGSFRVLNTSSTGVGSNAVNCWVGFTGN